MRLVRLIETTALAYCLLGSKVIEAATPTTDFTIKGHFIREVTGGDIVQHTGFSIICKDGRWRISVQSLQKEIQANAIRSAEFEFDGANTVISRLGSEVKVEGDFIPPSKTSFSPAQLWLAYLSGPYFSTNKTELARPVWHQDDPFASKRQFAVPTKHEKIPNGLGQPRFVEFSSDGNMRLYDRREQRSKTNTWPKPFDKGFVEAVYSVTSITNVGGIDFPKEFKFEKFGPRQEAGDWKRIQLSRLVGFTDSVELNAQLTTTELRPGESVVDTRTPLGDGSGLVRYQSVGGLVPSTNSDTFRRANRKTLESSPRPSKQQLQNQF